MTREQRLERCLGFFASVIKSGEPWTETCEAEYRAALAAPVEPAGKDPFPCPGDPGCKHTENSYHTVNGVKVRRCEWCHYEVILSPPAPEEAK